MHEIKITDKEFNFIRKLVYTKMGVNLTEAKRQLVIARLGKRLKKYNLEDFTAYINYLKKDPRELSIMLNLITTNTTHFFREKYHFYYLKDIIEKEFIGKTNKRNLRVWSAACSTGEEVYSIAITLKEHLEKGKKYNFDILASDINKDVLNIAQEGIYSYEKVKKIKKEILQKYFKMGVAENEGKFKVKDSLKKSIKWKQINLISPEYPFQEKIDIIFCRNVFIYFNKETQEKILGNFRKYLKPGGYLFLGHSENISHKKIVNGEWELKSNSVYK
ncbi:MAG: CheR family methyltransferase, partial [Bacillota bacterium]